MAWLAFVVSAGVIVYAGSRLSKYGDRLADDTGLGGLWIGVVLMAGATSLPEVLTTVSAALLDAPDIAVGDLLGAGLSNMLTLGIIDLLHRHKGVWRQAALEETLIAGLAIALTSLIALSLLIRPGRTVWGVGLDTLFVSIMYMLGMRVVFRQEDMRRRARQSERTLDPRSADERHDTRRHRIRHSAARFALAALTLLTAAPILAWSAREIAFITGISSTFVGTSLVAITTSLPELVSAVSAVRLGAFDLAVGNLFGSNAFNMSAICLADLAYRSGPLLSVASSTHAVTAVAGVLLMTIGLMGIVYRAEKRFWLIEPDSVLMILGYIIVLGLLYRLG
jgi:cation:H+ antiporter